MAAFAARYRWAGRAWRLRDDAGEAARAQTPPWRPVRRDIEALHAAYTGAGGEFHGDRNPIHRHVGGYQLYYLPRNAFRVVHVLADLPWGEGGPEPWWRQGPLRVLDLGAGSGAFSLGVLLWLAGLPAGRRPAAVELELVDQGRALLELAEANLRAVAARALPEIALRVRLRAHGLARELGDARARGGFTLAGGAMILNELQALGAGRRQERAEALFQGIRRRVVPGGALLFVEPGTRKGYLNMIAARTALMPAPVLHPCPHAEACPMFEPRVRRWCHATLRLPEGFGFDEELRRAAGLRLAMREVNLAALAVQAAPGERPTAPFVARGGGRIVSATLPSRRPEGEAVLLLCGPDGRLREVPAREQPGAGRGSWAAAHPPQGDRR